MKKVLTGIAALLLALAMVLTACKPNTPDGPGESGNKPDETTITITFNSEGGSAVDSITLKAGEALKLPAKPTREGYVFVKWVDAKDSSKEIKDGMTFDGKETAISARAIWEEDLFPAPEGDELKKAINEFLNMGGVNGMLNTAFIDPTIVDIGPIIDGMEQDVDVDEKTLKAWYKEIGGTYQDVTGHTVVSMQALKDMLLFGLGAELGDMVSWCFKDVDVFAGDKGFNFSNGGVVCAPVIIKSIEETEDGYEVLYHTDEVMGPNWAFCSRNLSYHEAENMKATLVWNAEEGHFVIKSNIPVFGAKKGWGVTNFLNKDGNNAFALAVFTEDNVQDKVRMADVIHQFKIHYGMTNKQYNAALDRVLIANGIDPDEYPSGSQCITGAELEKVLQRCVGLGIEDFTNWEGVDYDEATDLYIILCGDAFGSELKPTFVKEYEEDGRMFAIIKAKDTDGLMGDISREYVIERLFDGSFRFISSKNTGGQG